MSTPSLRARESLLQIKESYHGNDAGLQPAKAGVYNAHQPEKPVWAYARSYVERNKEGKKERKL